jgi:hypothetical protein
MPAERGAVRMAGSSTLGLCGSGRRTVSWSGQAWRLAFLVSLKRSTWINEIRRRPVVCMYRYIDTKL